jgi:hypothetical protein
MKPMYHAPVNGQKMPKKVVLIFDYLPVFLWYFFGYNQRNTKEIPKNILKTNELYIAQIWGDFTVNR